MNITQTDMAVIVSMSIAVILMSFAFPALGLTGDQATNPPDFNISENQFDFAGDFPQDPGEYQSGTLVYKDSQNDTLVKHWLTGDSSDGIRLTASSDAVGGYPLVDMLDYDGGTATSGDSIYTTGQNKTEKLETGDWIVNVTIYDAENVTSGWDFKADYQVTDKPGGLPLIGSIVYIGEVLAYGVGWLFQISANLLVILLTVVTFSVNLMIYLASNYAAIVAGAGGWASIILAIPGLVISFEFMKVIAVFLSLLPTT